MPNGVHALAPRLATDPPIETGVEGSIGTAVADAVGIIGAGLESGQATGSLTPAIRSLAGEYLGRVAMLQLEHQGGDADFTALVGCGRLHRQHENRLHDHAATVS
jgi:hypothetical protein